MATLTVLGSCGAWPEPGRACAGFLLTHDGFRLVLDLGFGTAARLLGHVPDGSVDAIVVTHEHPDHCADLPALGRARYYAGLPRLPLHGPPGVWRVLTAMEPRPDPGTIFDRHDLAGTTRIGPFRVTAVPLPHHVPNLGVRLSAPGLTVAYTGDSGPCDDLVRLAADADLLVADATLQGPPPEGEPRYVLTAGEAASHAARAGARGLLLTHFWPGSDRSRSLREAAAHFGGELHAAEEGLVLEL